jgi:glycogen debranching enzyme
MRVKDKLREAKEVIKKCAGKKGFYAGDDYKQYWARDFVYSLDTILKLGFANLAKSHFIQLFKKQKSTGEIPTLVHNKEDMLNFKGHISLFLDTLRYRGIKSLHPSNLAYLGKYHRWTADSGILVIVGLKKYEQCTKDFRFLKENEEKIRKLIEFIEGLIDSKFGFIRGSGWADAMVNYNDKFSLCTQVLLYKMYKILKEKKKAKILKNNINSKFWNENLGYYSDHLEGNRFDTLGNALAIIEDIVPNKRIGLLVEKFNIVSTNFGYRNLYPPYKMKECSQKPHVFQNSTIWPFIHAHGVIALVKKGFLEEAKREFMKMTKLKGFNEWYDPFTGKPDGSKNQLWSAALYIEAYNLV